jgi:putative intracellular protease/amidase
MDSRTRSIAVVLFDGFEVLDVFGPVELFSRLPDSFALSYVAAKPGPVSSAQGIDVIASESFEVADTPDIVLVPGGKGTRKLVDDREFLDSLAAWSSGAELITSVCTGSAVLAAAGLLDGYRATSNKKAFTWASSHGRDVTWVPQARWVEDRDRWTSSGVAAGMDMAAAIIAHLNGTEAAETAAREIELDIHTDPNWDPFAAHYGLG